MSAAEFDPILELKALRQALIQRLQEVQHQQSSDVQSEISAINEINDSDATIETEIESEQLLPRLQLARQRLSQLPIYQPSPPSPEFSELPKTKETETKEKIPKKKAAPNSKNIDLKGIDSFLPSFDVLNTANIVLMWIGFLGFLFGILFSFRSTGHNEFFVLPMVITGMVILCIGCLGQCTVRKQPITLNEHSAD
jgi:uncharacterized membrane protein